MKTSRADYDWLPVMIDNQTTLLIRDLDKGGMSVTNDIQRVMCDIAYEMGAHNLPRADRVFYRDSMNNWDEVKLDKGGNFVSFEPGPTAHDFEQAFSVQASITSWISE